MKAETNFTARIAKGFKLTNEGEAEAWRLYKANGDSRIDAIKYIRSLDDRNGLAGALGVFQRLQAKMARKGIK